MKNRKQAGKYVIAILAAAYFISPAATPVRAASASKAQPAGAVPTAGPKENWDSLVAAAKKEGVVSIYSNWRPQTRVALTEAFKAKYGINVEFTSFGRTPELVAKVQTEQRAGLFLADVFGMGANAFFLMMKPSGVLGSIEPLLVLPEVTDGNNWSTGRVPFGDKDKTFVGMISMRLRNIVFNTDMIKKGEITDYPDILKPPYKGKIVMNDPTMTGSGGDFITHLAVNIWDLARARDYLTQLVRVQEAVIEKDNRVQIESVARGKYPIGLAPNADVMSNFLKLGAHLDVVYFKQGVRVASGGGGFCVPSKQAHPNAGKLFVNWLLTREGQTVFSKAFGNPSFRTDVTTEGFNPILLAQPGEKIFPDSEDFYRHSDEVLRMAKQVVDAAYK